MGQSLDKMRECQAEAAYLALMRADKAEPSLRDNPYWTILKQDAYERYMVLFTGGNR